MPLDATLLVALAQPIARGQVPTTNVPSFAPTITTATKPQTLWRHLQGVGVGAMFPPTGCSEEWGPSPLWGQ